LHRNIEMIFPNIHDNNTELFFYRTHAGAEPDLLHVKGLKPVSAIEIKFSENHQRIYKQY